MAVAAGLPPASQPQRSETGFDDLTLAESILRHTQYLYALVLLTAFIGNAAWYSVYNAKKNESRVESTLKGPGGKPLPDTKSKREETNRKLGPKFGRAAKIIFRCLEAVVLVSYLATGWSMLIHAFKHEDPYHWSKEGLPWAGEWSVVRGSFLLQAPLLTTT